VRGDVAGDDANADHEQPHRAQGQRIGGGDSIEKIREDAQREERRKSTSNSSDQRQPQPLANKYG